MSEIKTQRTGESAEAIVAAIENDARRADCETLLALMKKATGQQPEVWTGGMVGFGTFHYKSKSGQEGDWFPVGFANRKVALTVYLGMDLTEAAPLLAKLGKHTTGKGCVYIKRLSDVDVGVLEQLVGEAYARIKREFG